MSEYDVIAVSIGKAIKIGWKFKSFVVVILLLIVAMKIYDIHLSNITNEKLERNYTAFKGNQRWDAFLRGNQHKEMILNNCIKHHGNPVWEGYPYVPSGVK